jgi:ELWxxDGT repeat protein
MNYTPSSSLPFTLAAAVNGKLCASAVDGVHGRELWTSDGTDAGTVPFKTSTPVAAVLSPAN